MALFGMGPAVNKALVEFKAGKMIYSESNNKVTPDKRKGLIQIVKSNDELIHFIWKDRASGATEDDLIVFPEDASFRKVKQTTGRVMLLEFKHTSRRLFFWMQEPKDDKDEEIVNKVNQYLNNPQSEESATPNRIPPGMENSLLQMLGRQGGREANINDLRNILTEMGIPSSAVNMFAQQHAQRSNQPQQGTSVQSSQSAPAQQGATSQPQNAPQAVQSLSQLIDPETVLPLLRNPAIQEQLLPHLPEGRRTPEELSQILNSPQFQQSLESFGSALQSGQLGDLLRQFGLDTGGASSIEALVRALQNQAQKEKKDDSKKDDLMETD